MLQTYILFAFLVIESPLFGWWLACRKAQRAPKAIDFSQMPNTARTIPRIRVLELIETYYPERM